MAVVAELSNGYIGFIILRRIAIPQEWSLSGLEFTNVEAPSYIVYGFLKGFYKTNLKTLSYSGGAYGGHFKRTQRKAKT